MAWGVEDEFENAQNATAPCKWRGRGQGGVCLASDGFIYCIPNFAERVLTMDPWKVYYLYLYFYTVHRPLKTTRGAPRGATMECRVCESIL